MNPGIRPPLHLPASVEVHAYADAAAAAQALTDAVADGLRRALAERPQASLMLSGGRSPIPFLQCLSQLPLDWARVQVGLVDDRWVEPGHADSNERLLREHLLRHQAASAQLIPLKTAEPTPEQGLAQAEQRVAQMPLPFDVLVLGVGDDGHTASLFPCAAETPAAMQSSQLLAATHPQTAPHARITLTFPALMAARALFVAIGGVGKRDVVEHAVAEVPPLPIGAVLLQRTGDPVQLYWSP